MTSRWFNITHHWFWMIPVLLMVAGLATHQIDRFPISIDELLSMNNAGYIGDDTSLSAILGNLQTYSEQHVPLYFIMLGKASDIVGWSPPALRLLSVWFGLLALAGVYRLGREHHSGAAGLYAAVFMAGLTLYGYYYPHIRMYTLLTMTAVFFLGSYLHLLRTQQSPRPFTWLSLSISTLLFLSSHIFSITLMIVVGLYHLLFVPKNRRWYQVSVAIIAGGLPLLLWLPVLVQGFEHTSTFSIVVTQALTPPEIVYHLARVYSNSLIPILVIGLGFLLYRSIRQHKQLRLWLGLSLGTAAVIVIIGAITPIIPPDRMRYTFVLLIPLSIAVGMGLAHFRYHVIMAGVVLGIWLGADLWMQRTVDMADYLGGLMNIYDMPRLDKHAPRIAAATDSDTLILTFSNHRDLTLEVGHGNTIQDFYFDGVDRQHYSIFLPLEVQEADENIQAALSDAFDGWSKLAFITEADHTPPRRIQRLYDTVLAERFQTCDTVSLSDDITLTRYVLIGEECPS